MAIQGTRYIVTTGATTIARGYDAPGALAVVVTNAGAGTVNLGGTLGTLNYVVGAGSTLPLLLLQGNDILQAGVVGGFATVDVLTLHRP